MALANFSHNSSHNRAHLRWVEQRESSFEHADQVGIKTNIVMKVEPSVDLYPHPPFCPDCLRGMPVAYGGQQKRGRQKHPKLSREFDGNAKRKKEC